MSQDLFNDPNIIRAIEEAAKSEDSRENDDQLDDKIKDTSLRNYHEIVQYVECLSEDRVIGDTQRSILNTASNSFKFDRWFNLAQRAILFILALGFAVYVGLRALDLLNIAVYRFGQGLDLSSVVELVPLLTALASLFGIINILYSYSFNKKDDVYLTSTVELFKATITAKKDIHAAIDKLRNRIFK